MQFTSMHYMLWYQTSILCCVGEDAGAGEDNEIGRLPPYPTQRYPDYRQNEHEPPSADKTMTVPVGTGAELRCNVETIG